jgi:hypothetical protein
MTKYLVLNYAGSGDQSEDDWNNFFSIVQKSGKFNGGSALGNRWGLTNTGIGKPANNSAVGYFMFTANNEIEVSELLKHCPIITSGGSFDIIGLETDG